MPDVNSKAKPLILSDEWFSQKAIKYCKTGEFSRLNIRRAMVWQMRKYGLTYEQIEDHVDRFCDAVDASPPWRLNRAQQMRYERSLGEKESCRLKFMPQSNQEYMARRFQGFHTRNDAGHGAGYDTVLPPNARDELITPRRPRILERKKPVVLVPSTPATPWYFLFFLALVLVGGVAGNLWRQWEAESAISQPVPAPHPTPAPAATPAPLPPGSASRWKEYLAAQQTRAPRATLVKLPPPRAQLVRLPEWKFGEERQLIMPYGLKVLGRYKGRLDAEWMLPASGNAIGDTWAIGDNLWVWITAPSASNAAWIDP